MRRKGTMDELNQGFNNDLSKTFDTDDLHEVLHACPKINLALVKVAAGHTCPYCGETIKK